MDQLVQSIIDSLKNAVPAELIIFLISLLPILELRGGILAGTLLGVDWPIAYLICVIGNLLPIPFILLFIRKIFDWIRNTRFVKLVDKLEAKAEKKSAKVTKYKKFGLFLFVAIPLPGTGGWTGALIASVLKMRFKGFSSPRYYRRGFGGRLCHDPSFLRSARQPIWLGRLIFSWLIW